MDNNIKITYHKKVNEFGFWKKYFQAYNFNKPKSERFTEFQLDAIAVLMSSDYYKSPLRGEQREIFVKKLNSIGYKFKSGNVYGRVIEPLTSSNILYKGEDDTRKGEYSINPQLRKVQKYIKEKIKQKQKVNISVAFDMIIDDKN